MGKNRNDFKKVDMDKREIKKKSEKLLKNIWLA